jgi:hypothetical protein
MPNKIPVRMMGLNFESLTAAARHFGTHPSAIHRALATGRENQFVPGRGKHVPCTIDGITYPSYRAAALALGVHHVTIIRRLRNATNR